MIVRRLIPLCYVFISPWILMIILLDGLYEEDHGIINNKFYDQSYNETFKYGTDTKWFNATEPIWRAAEREGKKSGAYMWTGNTAEYEGVTITKMQGYDNDLVDFRKGIDTVMDWFAKDGLQLACLYTNEPDKTGHKMGPQSPEVLEKVEELDTKLGTLLAKLEDAGMSNDINILIAADHGMAEVAEERTIDMSQWLNLTDVAVYWYFSANGLIWPKPGKDQEIMDALANVSAHFTAYRKEDLPEDLHYSNNSRVAEIVILVEDGWVLKDSNESLGERGKHGYDNKQDDMKTTFIANGPAFKCGYKQPTMNSVDIYPLICKLLGLSNCHQSRGTLTHTEGMLSTELCHVNSASLPQLSVVSMLIAVIIVTITNR